MDQSEPSSSCIDKSSAEDSHFKEVGYNPFKEMSSNEREVLVDSLHEALGRFTVKENIERTLEITRGNVDLAYDILLGGLSSSSSSFPSSGKLKQVQAEQDKQQIKIIEDNEVLNSITTPSVQEDVRQLIIMLPSHSSREILKMYRHCNRDKHETADRILDGYVIPAEQSLGKKIEVKNTGKGKGKEIDKQIKSEPTSNPFSGIFSSTPRGDTSSDSEHQLRDTPSSTVSSHSSTRGLPLRQTPWISNGSADRPTSPEPPTGQVKTDHDGYDIESDSDVEMSAIKDEIEEDIYGVSDDDKAARSLDSDSESGSSSSDSDDDEVLGNQMNTFAFDTGMSGAAGREKSQDEDVELSDDEKEAHLLSLFPRAKERAGVELLLAQGNMEEAAAQLEEEFGFRLESDSERSVSPGVGPSCPRKPDSLKRRAESSTQGRQTKRFRWGEGNRYDDDENTGEEQANELEPADKWILKLLHSETGVQVELDTGLHPCRIPENVLRHVPGFRTLLDANPLRVGECLKVPDVSLEIFNLAIQWDVCKTGQLTQAQRRTKAAEITALVDLAVFATTVSLSLGGSFVEKLKNILVKHRDALNGMHIQKAFEKLRAGHPVQNLLAQASLKPYVEFHHSGEDIHNATHSNSNPNSNFDSISDSDEEGLNPAQRAAYRKSRFRFEPEFNKLEDYRSELLEMFHKVWWSRNTRENRYGRGRHFCRITILTDPLNDEIFQV